MRTRAEQLAAVASVVAAAAIAVGAPGRGRGPMIETIQKLSDYVMSQEQDAMATAQRFGMHLHSHEDANITFSPRDPRFSRGSADREWKSQTLASVSLTVDAHSRLTIGELRAAFGPLRRSEGQHYDDPARFVTVIKRADKPLVCQLVVELQDRVEGDPTDDSQVKRLTLVPGPKS